MHRTLRLFPVLISPIVWNMCEHLHSESVYFKELYKEQEYYIQSGAAVVSTVTSILGGGSVVEWLERRTCNSGAPS